MARLKGISKVATDPNDIAAAVAPSGGIMLYGGETAPVGWQLCDGTELDQAAYPELFSALGTAYNTGGETPGYFRVPDLRQKFPIGKAASGTGSSLGESGGQIDHAHSVPAHYHALGAGADLSISSSGTHTTSISHDHGSFASSSNGNHYHSMDHDHGAANTGWQSHDHTHNGSTDWMNQNASHSHGVNDPQHLHGQTTTANPNSGNGTWPWGQGVRQTYDADGTNYTAYPMEAGTYYAATGISINYTDTNHTHNFTTSGIGQGHYHSFDVPNFTGTTNWSTQGDHNHTIDVPNYSANSSSDGAHTHATGNFSGRIGLVSGGADGNSVMSSGSQNPPYLVVNYIIKL